jgi:hypothetical protein
MYVRVCACVCVEGGGGGVCVGWERTSAFRFIDGVSS